MNDVVALDRLIDAKTALDSARTEYTAAIQEAIENGLSNRKIGELVGVSEAAIRMWRKRNLG